MADDEQLTPEEADVRNQAMLQDLRDMYSPVTKAQSLENVRNRLLAKQRTSTLNSIQNSKRFTQKRRQGRLQSMSDMLIPTAGKKGHYLNMLAAGVIAALLIGSLLFIVTHVHQSNAGGGGPTHSSPVSKPTPSPACNPSEFTPAPTPGVRPTVASGSTSTLSPTCDPGAKPTATPTPTLAPKVQPTATPIPTIGPGVQPTATPASGGVPTGAQPTATPAPGGTPTVAPGAQPTATPAPGGTPTVAPGVQLTATPAHG